MDIDSLLPEIEPTETRPELPEADISTDAPADKEPQARAEDGKFKGEAKKEADPAPEAKPEQKAEAKPEQKERSIPLAAHLEERRALKAELDAMKAQLAALQNPPKAPAPEPDYAADPKGYTDHKLQTALEKLQEHEKQLETVKQTAQQVDAQVGEQRFFNDLQAHEAAFVKEQPDYHEALQHIRMTRFQQLKILAPEMPDNAIAQQIMTEERGMAIQLARAGRDPVRTAYAIAQANGYRRKEAQAPAVELPKVAGPKTLPPDQTLGSGAGGSGESDDEAVDSFDAAFGEMFKKRA